MTIVRCPRCRDEVTAPAKASTKALVRCPLCLEEYLLSEALTGVPPALIVVGGEVDEQSAEQVGGDEYRLSGGGFAGVFDTSASADAAVAPSRPSVTAAPRPKKPEKNAALELVKIVLGGVVGLAIGLVVLWWGFRRDPLNLGPDVANYAPWLVPAQFHGKSKTTDSEAVVAPTKTRNASKPRAEEAARVADTGAELERRPSSAESAGFDSGPLDSPPAATKKEPADNAAEAKPAPPMPDLTDLLPNDTPPAELLPADAKSVPSAASFAQAMATATDALARYEGLPKEDAEARREAFTKLFEATSEVGRVISFLNPLNTELSEDIARLQDLLDTISGAKGSSKLNPVKFLASQQWPKAKSDDGLLVAGTVKAIQPAGQLFEFTLDASSRSEFFVPILTTTNPDELCAVGDVVVIVGRVLDEPQKHLPGYEGQQSRVLLLGHGVRAPKSE